MSIVQLTIPSSNILLLLRERIPKPQRLISRTRHNRLPIRTHGQIQDPIRMPRQGRDHTQTRVLPNAYLVLRRRRREAVRRDELVRCQRPREVTHLRTICQNVAHIVRFHWRT